MKRNRMRAAAALGVSVALAAGAAGVAYAADRAPPAAPQAQQDRDNGPNAGRRDRTADFLERRLDYLHRTIGITQAQEQLWTDFASAVREVQEDRPGPGPRFDRGPRMGRDFDRGPGPRQNLDRNRDRDEASVVERLERREQRLNDQSADLNRLLGALRPLYASLSPEQKRAADANLFHPERQRFAEFRRRGPRLNNFGDGRYGFDYGQPDGQFPSRDYDYR